MSAKFEIHFHAPVGQNINNVEHMDVHVDKEGQVQVINAEKVVSHNDDKHSEDSEPKPIDVLENLIFSKLFDSNEKLLMLRKEIAASIDFGVATPLYSDTIGLNRPKIDPQMKNEWFFILAALKDSNVLRSRPVKDKEFVEQMVKFFPMLPNLDFDSAEEYQKGMRQFAQSISVERRKWKIKDKVVRLVDLQAKQHLLTKQSKEKIDRIFRIAFPLYSGLCQLLQTIRK